MTGSDHAEDTGDLTRCGNHVRYMTPRRSCCHPRTMWSSCWFSRFHNYVCGAVSCATTKDLAEHVMCSDVVMATWYSCMVRGLKARRVGSARVKARRLAPGCGVNRRSRCLRGCSRFGPDNVVTKRGVDVRLLLDDPAKDDGFD